MLCLLTPYMYNVKFVCFYNMHFGDKISLREAWSTNISTGLGSRELNANLNRVTDLTCGKLLSEQFGIAACLDGQ